MKNMLAAFVAAASLTSAAPAVAHHPFTAEFDWKKPTTVMGTVTELRWTNPHVMLHVDVKDESGSVTNWVTELGSPSALMRAGWSSKTLKIGDEVTVEGWLAHDGGHRLSAKSVTASGRELFAASSFFDTIPRSPRPVGTTGSGKTTGGASR
jgi:hypothetical protein